MIELPDFPTESAILVRTAGDHLSLGWKAQNDGHARRRGVVITVIAAIVGLAMVVVLAVNAVNLIRQGEFGLAGLGAHLFMLVFAVGISIATGHTFRQILALPHCEVLVVRDDSIEYLEGMRPGGSPPGEDSPWSRLPAGTDFWSVWRVNRRARFEKAALRDVRIEGRESGRRVVVDVGERTHEIGEILSDADREWLLEALQRWRDAG